jgi:hypothetical protein
LASTEAGRGRAGSAGSILLPLVILLAAVLVGAVAMGVLALRQADQVRMVDTRHRLEIAFQALFPYPASRPGNMVEDFGFNPIEAGRLVQAGYNTRGWFLQALMDPAAVGALDPAQNPPPAFGGYQGAWCGPYWQQSLDNLNRPLDAWGRPLQLRWVTTPLAGWQVFSLGANGLDDTAADASTPAGDDLAYPLPPFNLPAPANYWQKNGYTLGTAQAGFSITDLSTDVEGSVFWTGLKDARTMDISFDMLIGGGSGADGLTLAFANAAEGMTPTFIDGNYLGVHYGAWEGANGLSANSYFVAFDTFRNPNDFPPPAYFDPSASFIGISRGGSGVQPGGPPPLGWLATANYPGLRTFPNLLHVRVNTYLKPGNPNKGHQVVEVYMNNVLTLTYTFGNALFLPSSAYVGFTSSTGGANDYHNVYNIQGISP